MYSLNRSSIQEYLYDIASIALMLTTISLTTCNIDDHFPAHLHRWLRGNEKLVLNLKGLFVHCAVANTHVFPHGHYEHEEHVYCVKFTRPSIPVAPRLPTCRTLPSHKERDCGHHTCCCTC